MTMPTFDAVVGVLTERFHVERERIRPETALADLGLDSLSLMEFVFAIEDHFSLRIPEDKLDPRQADLTLADLCRALDEASEHRTGTSTAT
jgi:acyl carrier protein